MISASLSLSLPRLGWKSTSTPRSLKICTAAGDSASEMRTLGFVMGLPEELMEDAALGGDGNSGTQGGGERTALERHGGEHAAAQDIADQGAADRVANILPRAAVIDAQHPALLAFTGTHRQHQPGATHRFHAGE